MIRKKSLEDIIDTLETSTVNLTKDCRNTLGKRNYDEIKEMGFDQFIEEGNSWALVDQKGHLLGFVITHVNRVSGFNVKKIGPEIVYYACINGKSRDILNKIKLEGDCIWGETKERECADDLVTAGFQPIENSNVYVKMNTIE